MQASRSSWWRRPISRFLGLSLVVVLLAAVSAAVSGQRTVESSYFPPAGSWETAAPEAESMDPAALKAAVAYAVAHERNSPKDLALDQQETFKGEPFIDIIGPTGTRAPLNGLIVRHGRIVAEWGETNKVDMTNSITKSFLSTVVGLAWQQSLIRDLNDRAVDYMPDSTLFATPHNAKITWEHLLRQTSDWQGTLWTKPDWADRPVGETPADYPNRPSHEPGTFFKYNDVRVNALALATLNVWRRPLPQVLREQVMDPIGASNTWRWHGYQNSWVPVDGQQMQSVSGGGHWGGGMFISARDLARFGYLFLRDGEWNGNKIVSDEWIRMARTPGRANKEYGFMNWYLNTDGKSYPSAPRDAVLFLGAGVNILYIDKANDLVIVLRWTEREAIDPFIGKVLAAIRS